MAGQHSHLSQIQVPRFRIHEWCIFRGSIQFFTLISSIFWSLDRFCFDHTVSKPSEVIERTTRHGWNNKSGEKPSSSSVGQSARCIWFYVAIVERQVKYLENAVYSVSKRRGQGMCVDVDQMINAFGSYCYNFLIFYLRKNKIFGHMIEYNKLITFFKNLIDS